MLWSKTLDICVKNENKLNLKIDNTIVAIKKFLKEYNKNTLSVYLAMENTGRYNWNLEVLRSLNLLFCYKSLHLKKEFGINQRKEW
jgi:hypothetical protein